MSFSDPAFDAHAHRPLLERHVWFAGLPEALKLAMLDVARLRRLRAGEVLFRRGQPNCGLYAVLRGSVHVGTVSRSGRQNLVAVVPAPHWFGELALIDGGPRTHDTEAREPTDLLWVPLPDLHALLDRAPQHWQTFAALAVHKLRAAFEELEDAALLGTQARVAKRLLQLSTGHGMLTAQGALRTVALNQEEFAATLGLTRQTVNEVLGLLADQGFIAKGYGRVEILDPAGLLNLSRPS